MADEQFVTSGVGVLGRPQQHAQPSAVDELDFCQVDENLTGLRRFDGHQFALELRRRDQVKLAGERELDASTHSGGLNAQFTRSRRLVSLEQLAHRLDYPAGAGRFGFHVNRSGCVWIWTSSSSGR